jgi:hypothetical protein
MDLFATVSRLPFSVLGPHRSDTCTVDRLNYKYTVIILVIFSIIVSNKQFSSDHIACWVPGHFTRSYEVYSNNICWVSNTYYVAAAETLPLDENKKKTRVVKVIHKQKNVLIFKLILFVFFIKFLVLSVDSIYITFSSCLILFTTNVVAFLIS